jgi:eukaryotic-like serine/threonine-protein kinase
MQGLPTLNNRYRLVEPLGSGAVANIFRAEDLTLARQVAIKLLKYEYTRDPAFQRRFLHEAQALARLDHPNLVRLYDFGVENEQYYMVMELVEGSDLKTHLTRRGALPPYEAVWIALQLAEGLGLAHRAGLVHCDVKPQNVLLRPDLQPKLTDFGIARSMLGGEADEEPWGTPQYFSPEQARGEALTPASDIYSLGVVLFEMATGHLPFHGKDPRALALQHVSSPPPSPRGLAPKVPAELEAVILRMLAKDPRERFRNGEQAARFLRSLLQAPSAEAPNLLPASGLATAIAAERPVGVDWLAIGLAFLALVAVGGLIPLTMWVYLLYFPPPA